MMRRLKRCTLALAALYISSVLTGCAMTPVQPWQKEHLAHPQMGFDVDRLDARYTDHIYFRREASSGGASIGGGGCGCN